MATLCLDSDYDILVSESPFTNFSSGIENHCGDIPFVPLNSGVVSLAKPVISEDPRGLLIVLSSMIAVVLAVVAWSQWKVFMSYIPLYISLVPVFYWLLKIAVAYAYSKSHAFEVKASNEEIHESHSLIDYLVNIVSRILHGANDKRHH